jgi:galactokinase/mevalonate kinase-like predicted kinase
MIVSKTPLRMSYVGGGSDLSSFYRHEMGAVLSTTIDKYIYVAINKPFNKGGIFRYSSMENSQDVDSIKHPIIREALKLFDENVNQIINKYRKFTFVLKRSLRIFLKPYAINCIILKKRPSLKGWSFAV